MEQQLESLQRDYNTPKSSLYKPNNEGQNPQLIEELRNLHETGSHRTVELTEYEDDDNDDCEEEEEDENELRDVTFKLETMRYADARMGVCSVCRYSITSQDASPANFEKALLCSDGHLLCHQCIVRFAIQLDMNCVLCAATEAHYNLAIEAASSVSRTSSIKSIKPKSRNRVAGLRHCWDKHSTNVPISASQSNVSHYNEHWDETEDERSKNLVSRHRSYCDVAQHESPPRTQINSQMISECSRRPIQCPRLDCAVNVAFSALTNHFLFDHPEVPILSVDPGEKSTLIVNFDGLIYDSSRCLALLLVSRKLSGPAARQFNGNHVHTRYKNRLPLPILAARLRCNASKISNENNHNDDRDVVITWVAGLDIGNATTGALCCSIQAIDSINGETAFRSLTYTGPINSLRTAQQPREVFLTGDCVILHDGFISHIASGCENLNINVTIH
ncbi:uncharacterized protein LOC131666163 [Phymastichus coffea]|uniref:uncharacterized protein LOC131666163 n=1 Tax=Phymastichus coffea TaxID=108790 RepID=UPI00273B1D4E|nr:uncharacterized protein LOC131666163 [Phymastichus coffea]